MLKNWTITMKFYQIHCYLKLVPSTTFCEMMVWKQFPAEVGGTELPMLATECRIWEQS